MRCGPRRTISAFTIVELIVVISVIAIILAIAVPGLSAVSLESRFNAATQTVNGALSRAYYSAVADGAMTAVRFVPGEWDSDETAEARRPTGRQNLATYRYVSTSAADPLYPAHIEFGEYFQRREGTSSIQLPSDVWVAPVESLATNAGNAVMKGTNTLGAADGLFGWFALDAEAAWTGFLQADDFLIAFDPQTGLRGGSPRPTALKAYVPEGDWTYDVEDAEAHCDGSVLYQRYMFSGIVLYRREPFVALGDYAGVEEQRQAWLRANGRPFLLHRFGGGLVMGTQGGQ